LLRTLTRNTRTKRHRETNDNYVIRNRHCKVSFNTPDMARLCLRKKGNLIHHAQFSKIFIRDDKTPLQLKHLQSLREELNIMRQQGDDRATIKYVHNIPQIINKKN
jgi:hypothetical protein